MGYDSALRSYPRKRIEEIEKVDIIVGIPCYNNDGTIEHVIQMVTHGLNKHYRDLRSLIYIADGGSTDDTREVAKEFEIKPWQEKLVGIYRGPAGKGTAFRAIFEAVKLLEARACAVVDSDLRSITSDWIRYLLDPVLENGYEYVSPIYTRHKYDGTITNNVVYNLTRTLYGKRIRQPIGGEFGGLVRNGYRLNHHFAIGCDIPSPGKRFQHAFNVSGNRTQRAEVFAIDADRDRRRCPRQDVAQSMLNRLADVDRNPRHASQNLLDLLPHQDIIETRLDGHFDLGIADRLGVLVAFGAAGSSGHASNTLDQQQLFFDGSRHAITCNQ